MPLGGLPMVHIKTEQGWKQFPSTKLAPVTVRNMPEHLRFQPVAYSGHWSADEMAAVEEGRRAFNQSQLEAASHA